MTSRIVFAFVLSLAAAGCHAQSSSGSGGNGGEGGGVSTGSSQGVGGSPGVGGGAAGCTTMADCTTGDLCVFSIRDACMAHGVCVPPPTPEPCGVAIAETACGCDGQEVKWVGGCEQQLPDGYAPAPIAHVGACNAPPQCTMDTDCTPANGYTPPEGFTHGECAYPQSEGCAARGVCVNPFPMCNSLVEVVGCACDGTEVEMGCGYPSHTYAPKPLAHLGPCDG